MWVFSPAPRARMASIWEPSGGAVGPSMATLILIASWPRSPTARLHKSPARHGIQWRGWHTGCTDEFAAIMHVDISCGTYEPCSIGLGYCTGDLCGTCDDASADPQD